MIPPITARLLTDNFNRMMVLSVVFGAAAGFVGIYASYYVDIASGASIVLVSAGGFIVAMLWSTVRNHLATMRGMEPATAEMRAGQEVIYD